MLISTKNGVIFMKKFLAILMSLTVVFSAIGVSAASVPKFMEATYNNYTAD